ncbi:ISAs1 family transposase [Streptomyces sp. TR06-5]|uniref:ISAs1 family transposase n=1 Tax=Streptomyces sp. TR06-5 TaxID=3385976 RepID=UPI00399F5FD0
MLSAVTHHRTLTLAQAEVGAKTNETAHFRPLLQALDLAGALVTFDALHSVQANVNWLVETKNAHYIAMIKRNQPTAYRQLAALPWPDVAVQHTASWTGHGRHESRSIKTCGFADELGGIAFPHARLALRVHRRRRPTGRRETRETIYAVTSRRPPGHPGRTRRRRPRPLEHRSPPPHQRRDLRRGRLHPPCRHRTPRHGHLPRPRHRPAQNPWSRQHR